MSKGNTFEDGLLNLVLNNIDLANIGDATGLRGSSTAGSLYIALHSADPGEGGSQTTSELSYGSYARVAVARNGSGWNVSSGVASNASAITFPTVSSGSGSAAYFSVGTASSGAGTILYSAAVSASHTYVVGEYPYFAANGLQIGED